MWLGVTPPQWPQPLLNRAASPCPQPAAPLTPLPTGSPPQNQSPVGDLARHVMPGMKAISRHLEEEERTAEERKWEGKGEEGGEGWREGGEREGEGGSKGRGRGGERRAGGGGRGREGEAGGEERRSEVEGGGEGGEGSSAGKLEAEGRGVGGEGRPGVPCHQSLLPQSLGSRARPSSLLGSRGAWGLC